MNQSVRIGVVSDTHIPDRALELHPRLMEELRQRQPDLILHAGDISTWRVIEELQQIAPVRAVSGNRDFLLNNRINRSEALEINGVPVVLTHGHLNFLTYWQDKFRYVLKGYQREDYLARLSRAFPRAKVIIFGHSHHAENLWEDGQLFFNPGSVSNGDIWERKLSFGWIEIDPNGVIKSEIIPLNGVKLVHRLWQKSS